jgi:hypothetical protein
VTQPAPGTRATQGEHREPTSESTAAVERVIDRYREKLLDLSKRNRLLNFTHGERSRQYVRVIDELPAVLLERLLSCATFKFKPVDGPGTPALAVEEAARRQRLDPSFELPIRSGEVQAHHTDKLIQVLHFPEVMARRLEAMRQDHVTSIQELGVPSLYAAFGFLEWFETKDSPTPLLSPLVLVPLEIERKRERGEYVYSIFSTSDEPELNRTLAFRLKREGVVLPSWDVVEKELDVDRYLASVAKAIEGNERWRVRRFVTVTTLSFARQVLYEDLTPERWIAAGGRSRSPIVRALLAGEDPPPVEATPTANPVLVTEADSTQIAAISDALAGRNMVVKGPPGTGKSQTITNLIAAALHQGKTVLFVAEKMAALEVVKKRLDDTGLGAFCLSLHSTRARKREVLEALKKSISLRAAEASTEAPRPNEPPMSGHEALESYKEALATPGGLLDPNVQGVLWREQALRSSVVHRNPELVSVAIGNAVSIGPAELADARRRADELAAAIETLRHDGDPWSFVTTWIPQQSSAASIVEATRRWCEPLRALQDHLSTLGCTEDLSIDAVADLGGQLADLSHVGADVPGPLLATLVADDVVEAVETLASDLETRHDTADEVARVLPVEAARLVSSALLRLEGLVAQRLVDPQQDYASLSSALNTRREELGTLSVGVIALHDLWLELRAPGTWEARTQRVLVLAASLAAEAGHELLHARSGECLRHDRSAVLHSARDTARKLQADAAIVDEDLKGWAELGPVELRRHATILRSTGFFGRLFGSEYRNAVRAYRELSTGRSAEREVMAQRLQDAAEHLDNVKAWAATPGLAAACGDHFSGLGTDFGLLQRISDWGFRVRATLPANDPTSRWARELLFSADEEPLASLRYLWEEHGQALLAALSDEVSLAEVVRRRGEALDDATAALAEIGALEVRRGATLGDVVEAARRLVVLSEIEARLATSSATAHLGALWRGPSTAPAPLRAACAATRTLRDIAFPPFVSTWLLTAAFEERRERAIMTGRSLVDLTKRERAARIGMRHLGVSLAELPPTVSAVLAQLEGAVRAGADALALRGRYLTARVAAEQLLGLATVCSAIERGSQEWSGLADGFEWCVLRTLCRDIASRYPELGSDRWAGTSLAHLRASLRELERHDVEARRKRVAAELAAKPVPPGRRGARQAEWTERALLEHEIGKQKRNIAIRALVARARDAIVSLTPCLMMSPLSIAQFLEDARFQFDLLIVDEASQLRPEDSLGALLRARQVVVVGDEQQLPPTTFFARTDTTEEEDGDEEQLDAESLLDLAMRAFGEARVLRWHYRSRHDSLIAFCNRTFYDGALVVAPSPLTVGPGLGVEVKTVTGVYEKSINEPEADEVIATVFELMRRHPKRSIGVVAMNQAQATRIREPLFAQLPDTASAYIDTWEQTLEPFFVKNLENVQGDERDIMVISTTYGPDRSGRVYQRFGPLVGAHGHRRLNVLFSRAKYHMVVVTSLRPDQIEVKAGSPRGVVALRDYLADHAIARTPTHTTETSDRFAGLSGAIRDLGFDVVEHVGAAPLALDLAVVHPDAPGSYVAGVEVDAAALHPSVVPHDRDHVRPLVLKQRRWEILSEWTSDWHREPEVSRTKLRERLRAACAKASRPMPAPRARVTSKVGDEVPLPPLDPAPPLLVEVRAEGEVKSIAEARGSRIRVGRSQHCDIRIPDGYEEVAPRHFELVWDGTTFSIGELETRAGVYLDGTRVGSGPIPLLQGRTYAVRCGLGRVTVRLAYGSELASMSTSPGGGAPRSAAASAEAPGLLQTLASDEQKFLTLLRENDQVSSSQLAAVLGKSAVRVNGLVRNLRRRLMEAGVPPFFEDSYLPGGDVMFRRTGSVP